MKQIELDILPDASLDQAEQIIEDCCRELTLTMKDTLAKYPGCVHWHFKQGKARGTLEITYWPREHRIWITIQAGRTADWIEPAAMQIKQLIEQKINPTLR